MCTNAHNACTQYCTYLCVLIIFTWELSWDTVQVIQSIFLKNKLQIYVCSDIERKWQEIFLVLNTINVSFTLSLTVATARQRSSLHLFNSYLQHLLRRLCFYILNMYKCTLWYFSVEIKQNTKKRAIVFNVDIWWGYWTLSLEPASRPV